MNVMGIASEIDREYRDKNPMLLVVLKGAFVFAADLIRQLTIPHTIEFLHVQSYVGTTSIDVILRTSIPECNDRHVIIVEDIIDTGKTVDRIKRELQSYVASVKVCALLDKPSRREIKCKPDFKGFTVPDIFLIGYGLDYLERYRWLVEICRSEEIDEKR